MYLVVVKIKLVARFAAWKAAYDAHRQARRDSGIEDVFCHPVLGEQAALYAVKTASPRMVLDMIYEPENRAFIEASGHVIGQETVTICEVVD